MRVFFSFQKMHFATWWRRTVIEPIHKTRIYLPPVRGIPAATYMQFVYPVPVVVGGWYVMQWAISRSHENIGQNGEKLRDRRDLLGGKNNIGLHKQNDQLAGMLNRAQERST